MKKETFAIGGMTIHDWRLIRIALITHCDWGIGGMFGDGEKIVDKKGEKRAKKIILSISRALGSMLSE